nr:phosphoglucomutase [uncultured Carboxylicivirga sp.]
MAFNWNSLQNGSDIRGVALEGVPGETVNLNERTVARLAEAFVLWLKKKSDKHKLKIAVGMDSRLSGPDLKASFINSLVKQGVDVMDCALASTPAMFMTTVTKPYLTDGAVMLTASHLPFNRNGLKFFTSKGGLEKADISEILSLAASGDVESAGVAGTIENIAFIDVYSGILAEKIKNEVNSENFDKPLDGFKIVLDAGNGAGGFYAYKVLKYLGADISGSQFLDPDGRFLNHIPNPEDNKAMSSICEAVKETKADLGIIFDTDVDRAAIVDELANPINRNELIALSAAIINEEHPGSVVVTDSITSDGLSWFINDHLKATHHRFKRGYKNVINESIRLNKEGKESWLAIETSGHAALKENYFLDDGAYLVTKILIKMARLKKEGKTLTSLIEDLPQPADSKEFRIKIEAEDFRGYGEKVINDLELFASAQEGWKIMSDNYEGVRVACEHQQQKGWFLLRLSLHDPVIPLNIESDIKGGVDAIADQLVGFFEEFKCLNFNILKNR